MTAPDTPGEITLLLAAARDGERDAMDRVFGLVYRELRSLAHRQLGYGQRDGTLQTTALVHEAYLKLARRETLELRDRAHFFALAARAMRQILVDYARERLAQKRGGGALVLELDEGRSAASSPDDGPFASDAEVLALDAALTRLATLDERLGKLVELRFFGGLSVEETAKLLAVSDRTVKRDWRRARAFLHVELAGTPPP
jgi:RNA polymerase sigma factor (TIGR02999 family)